MTVNGTPDAAEILTDLVATCRKGEHRFRAAADGVADPTLKRLFQTYAEQRAGFVRELERELALLDKEEAKPGEGAGELEPGRIDSLTEVVAVDEAAIISERERGEQDALTAYAKAAGRRLPDPAGATVERQYLQVKDAHEHVRSLERALADIA